jgi:hypothetical protein
VCFGAVRPNASKKPAIDTPGGNWLLFIGIVVSRRPVSTSVHGPRHIVSARLSFVTNQALACLQTCIQRG